MLEKYKYDACGLTFLSTHYWQIANGRHRIIPNIYNGGADYEHVYLDLKDHSLLDVLQDKVPFKKVDRKSAQESA